MAKYRVRLVQTVIEETYVTVEAENKLTAETAALEAAFEPACPAWSFLEMQGGLHVTDVDELP